MTVTARNPSSPRRKKPPHRPWVYLTPLPPDGYGEEPNRLFPLQADHCSGKGSQEISTGRQAVQVLLTLAQYADMT